VLTPQLLCSRDDGLAVWRVQHDREEFWLSYWYRLGTATDGTEFDVREVPGYTAYPRCPLGQHIDAVTAHFQAEQRHHAEIIAQALDAAWRPS
jgi:hypothetical protein